MRNFSKFLVVLVLLVVILGSALAGPAVKDSGPGANGVFTQGGKPIDSGGDLVVGKLSFTPSNTGDSTTTSLDLEAGYALTTSQKDVEIVRAKLPDDAGYRYYVRISKDTPKVALEIVELKD